MKKINYKWIVISIIIYVGIVLGVLFVYYAKRGNSGYLILSDDAIYYKEKHKWEKYYNDIFTPTPVTVLTSTGTKELEITRIKGKLEYYQDESQIILEEPLLMAYSNKLNLKFKDYELEPIAAPEIKKFDEILKKHDIIGYEHLSSRRLSYDFDHDGLDEVIYFVTNLFLETTYDKVFSFAYYIKGNEIIYLNEQVGTLDQTYDLCIPTVKSIIDLNDDQKDEVIFACEYFNNIGVSYSFYQIKNHNFIKMEGV